MEFTERKIHNFGIDSHTKHDPCGRGTPAHVHDTRVLPELLHGEETRVWGDAAYAGQGEVLRRYAPRAKDFTQRKGYRYRALTKAAGEESGQGEGPSRGRASVSGAQATLWVHQDALPRS